MSTETGTAAATVTMPPELAARGWTLNKLAKGGGYKVRNSRLGKSSSVRATPEEAIDDARQLDRGKTIVSTPKGEISFAPATAAGSERKNIGWGIIRIDGGTQPREGIDQETVDKYAEHMLNRVEFPPLVVFFDGKFYWLADGFHRYFAHKKHVTRLGPGLDVEVHQGTQRDAVLYSLGANETHGLPRTPADKRAAVLKLLNDPEWSEWSDGVIAEKAKVSQPFVSKLRRELEFCGSSRMTTSVGRGSTQNVLSGGKPPAPKPVARRGKDNRVITTGSIGKRPAARLTPARDDIDVTATSAKPVVDKTAPGAWPEQSITIGININAGKSDKRGILISGRAGDGKPLFISEFNLADLDPMPPALASLQKQLVKIAAKSAAKR